MSKRSAAISFDPRVGEWDETTPVTENGSHIKEGLARGAAHWAFDSDGVPTTLKFMCPCGCNEVCTTPIISQQRPKKTNQGWSWNGDLKLPTLTPSIRRLSKCAWHGYLRKGVFEEC